MALLSSRGFWRRVARLWGVANVVLIALTFVWSHDTFQDHGHRIFVVGSTTAQLLALILLSRHIPDKRQRQEPSPEHQQRFLDQLVDGEPELIFDYAPMAKLLLQPRRFHLRLSERLTITRDGLAWEQDSTWRLPGASGSVHPLPLLWVVKGTLLNELEVVDGDGKLMAIAPYETSLRLAVQVWLRLARTQYRYMLADSEPVEEAAYERAFRDGVAIIAATISNEERASQPRLRAKRDELVKEWRANNPAFASADDRLDSVAQKFLWQFAGDYLVVAFDEHAAEPCTYRLRYSMDFEPRVKGVRVGARRFRPGRISAAHFLARAIGRFPPVMNLDIEQAYTAKSYHLQINLPHGDHFADGSVLDEHGSRVLRPRLGRYAVDQPYFRRSRLGTQRLHLYTRSFGTSDVAHASLYVRVSESPWRTLAGSTFFSTIACALLWMLITWDGSADTNSLVATVIGMPISLAGAVFAFRPPLRRTGLSMSLAGSAFYLVAGALLLIGVFGVLDDHGHWAELLRDEVNRTLDVDWIRDFAWPERTTVLRTVARVLTLSTAVAWATLLVRASSWYSHYRSDRAARR